MLSLSQRMENNINKSFLRSCASTDTGFFDTHFMGYTGMLPYPIENPANPHTIYIQFSRYLYSEQQAENYIFIIHPVHIFFAVIYENSKTNP